MGPAHLPLMKWPPSHFSFSSLHTPESSAHWWSVKNNNSNTNKNNINGNRSNTILITDEASIVQTFNSCSSRPDVCQCLVTQTPMNNISNNKANTWILHAARLTAILWYVNRGRYPVVYTDHASQWVKINSRALATAIIRSRYPGQDRNCAI